MTQIGREINYYRRKTQKINYSINKCRLYEVYRRFASTCVNRGNCIRIIDYTHLNTYVLFVNKRNRRLDSFPSKHSEHSVTCVRGRRIVSSNTLPALLARTRFDVCLGEDLKTKVSNKKTKDGLCVVPDCF